MQVQVDGMTGEKIAGIAPSQRTGSGKLLIFWQAQIFHAKGRRCTGRTVQILSFVHIRPGTAMIKYSVALLWGIFLLGK
jgi:hypothetical protein